MRAADLDRRATFQRAVTSTNALNESVPAGWDLIATVSARRDPVSDGEVVRAAQVQRVVTDRFTVRWRPDLAQVTGGDQIVCEGEVYDVQRRKELGRRTWLEFSAVAQADDVADGDVAPDAAP